MAFVNETIAKEFEGVEGAEDKIGRIVKEHESDVTGLKMKNKELVEKENKLKAQLAELTAGNTAKEAEALKKIEDLEAQIKASGGDELKSHYDAEVKKLVDQHSVKLNEWEKTSAQKDAAINTLNAKYLRTLENTEYNQSIAPYIPRFREGTRLETIRDLLRSRYSFELVELEGVEMLKNPNDSYKTINDTVTYFFGTEEGKSFLLANSSGGGSTGNTGTSASKNTMTRDNFDKMSEQEKSDFCAKGGQIG